MSDNQGAMVGGLIGLAVVAVVLIVLGASLVAMLPMVVAAGFLVLLLVRDRRA